MKIILLHFLFLSLAGICSDGNLSAEYDKTKLREKLNRLTASFHLGYNSLNNNQTNLSISGPGVEMLLQYALNPKWAIGLSLKQMNLGNSGSGAAVNFRGTYAITGQLWTESSEYYLNNDLIVEKQSLESPCWCLQLTGSQYYFNRTTNTVPFSGIGIATYYKYPTKNFQNLILGIQYESVKNEATITALSIYSGIEFRI